MPIHSLSCQKRYVLQGGILLTGAFSGMVNENDHGYPGSLRKLTEKLNHLDQVNLRGYGVAILAVER